MKKKLKYTGFPEINIQRFYYNGTDPWFCEIAITGRCNFNCKYCNKFSGDIKIGDLEKYFSTFNNCKRIHITGGEPTLHKDFFNIIELCNEKSKSISISTNGTFGVDNYLKTNTDLFLISLDDYDNDILTKRGYKNPQLVIETIKKLSKIKIVSVGLVIDNINFNRIEDIIDYILSLGVNDIRLSVSTKDEVMPVFNKTYSKKYPTLRYRVENFKKGLQMRGCNSKKCYIARNDVTIVGNNHYPCLIYFREGGRAIGSLSDNVYEQRCEWSNKFEPQNDLICKKYCMDFKSEFNCFLER